MKRKHMCDKIYKCIRTAVIWFFFQVLACLLPLLIGVGITLYIGYKVELANIFPDILLAAFAIGMNLWGIGIKKREKTPEFLKDIHSIFVGVIVSGAMGLYMCLFNGGYVANYILERVELFDIPDVRIKWTIIILGILILFDVVVAALSSVIENKEVRVGKISN